MKAFVLKKIANKLKNYKFIKKALRVDENLILLRFDEDDYFFDLTKGNSDIYININYPLIKKFKAPFDIVLEKKFTKAKLIDVLCRERILTIIAKNQRSFKEEIVKLRFEFTGRYTNAIILDENDTIIEALRHISPNLSSRVVKPGIKLQELPPKEIKEKVFEIDDLQSYTQGLFKKKYAKKIEDKKNALLKKTDKKISLIKNRLDSLEDENELLKKSELYKKYADIAMANLHKIRPYDESLEAVDFEGKSIKIPIPQLKNINEIGNYYYNLSKKAKRKSASLHIQKSHLQEQLNFLQNYKKLISKASHLSELKSLTPPKKEKKEDENVAKFMFDDYVILVGKNEKGNIRLLKEAGANDYWFHIKNYPGAHVIVKNNRQSINEDIIQKSAKLALAFSGKDEGEVDYTKRKFVKTKEGAKVEYGKYNTIKVRL
ncbi:MAG: DUF814 domain-containing protein [Epsilonproteobacteria bacterium]|nr:DUF814 domain-containing protein [Campylobacterota bacterium]